MNIFVFDARTSTYEYGVWNKEYVWVVGVGEGLERG
jgi:hypothetical protein